jgi:predicted O-methyltransferase YrrM
MTIEEIVQTGLKMEGWSTAEKLTKMVELVLDRKPKVLVEVGIYGGRSYFPMHWAAQEVGGKLYGCDPYLPQASASPAGRSAEDIEWWSKLNHHWIYTIFKAEFDLLPEPKPCFQMVTSREFDVKGVDFLHLDSNHAEDEALEDVKYWTKRMNPGSILVVDDVDWPSQAKAVALLDKKYKLLESIKTTNIVNIYEI